MDSIQNVTNRGKGARCSFPQVSVHHLFEIQVENSPDSIAVCFENESITYSELNSRSNQLARYLQKLSVGPEVLVGVFLERSIEVVVVLLGILKAGGAYIPLDPSHPRERLKFMISDSEMPVLLTKNLLLETLPCENLRVVSLDMEWKEISKESKENLSDVVEPESMAYLIYTSGSTGKPKGVQICHKSLVNLLYSMKEIPGIQKEDRLLSVAALSFDMSVYDIFMPLAVGASITFIRHENIIDGEKLAHELENNSITMMQATPATWRMLLDAGWRGDKKIKILCGGEALPRALANQLLDKGSSVWNMYGLTELAVYSVISKVQQGDDSVSIGYPIHNTEVYILDEALNPVEIGEVGEMYIGGEGVARGYLNQPELTSERFISNSFSNEPSYRIYKTGDLARFLQDGSIEYVGRSDYQVKIRGYRIELGEIEKALEQHPEIKQAVVVVKEEKEDKIIAAYFMTKSGSPLSNSNLRSFLGDTLPHYMIPSFLCHVENFPLTPNGKVDRKNLEFRMDTAYVTHTHYEEPTTFFEKEVARIWSGFLNIEDIGIHDNFLELGGHSLLANRLTLRINENFGVKLSLMEVLTKGLTIKDMVNLIENKLLEDANAEDIESMLGELERLSEDELKVLMNVIQK